MVKSGSSGSTGGGASSGMTRASRSGRKPVKGRPTEKGGLRKRKGPVVGETTGPRAAIEVWVFGGEQPLKRSTWMVGRAAGRRSRLPNYSRPPPRCRMFFHAESGCFPPLCRFLAQFSHSSRGRQGSRALRRGVAWPIHWAHPAPSTAAPHRSPANGRPSRRSVLRPWHVRDRLRAGHALPAAGARRRGGDQHLPAPVFDSDGPRGAAADLRRLRGDRSRRPRPGNVERCQAGGV